MFYWLVTTSLIGPSLKFSETLEAPNIEIFTPRIEIQCWPTYVSSRTKLCWTKHMGQSEVLVGHVGEFIGKLGNVLGTQWKLDEIIVWIWWEHNENQKNPKPFLAPTLPKRKKIGLLGYMMVHPISCQNFLCHFFTIFSLG
jgi:hypothetical protein